MRLYRSAGVAVAALLLAVSAGAQEATPSKDPARRAQPRSSQPTSSESNPDGLGVSLQQIRKLTDPLAQRKVAGKGLRYDFYVNVYGLRPQVDFFKDFDLLGKGMVGWGSVTHQELIDAATPVEFRIKSTSTDVLSALRNRKKKQGK